MHKALTEAGYRLIPLRDKQKRPLHDGWGTNKYSLEDLGQQVGLVIEPGMVDVDLDWPELRTFATGNTYNTMAWGRQGKVTHFVYRAELPEPVTFALPQVAGCPKLEGPHGYTICELRTSSAGEAYQAMIPGSTHPDGDQLQWRSEIVPQEIDADALVQSFGTNAALAVLTRFYPGHGRRDDFALALTGCMVRAGWSDDQIKDFMVFLCRAVGDDEIKMRSEKARRTIKQLESGRKVAGIPKAAELMGIPIEWMVEIAVWLGWKQRNPVSKGSAVFLSPVVKDVAKQAWDALAEYQIDGDPAVYAFGETLARVDDGRMQMLGADSLKHELNRCAAWLAQDDGKWKNVSAPKAVVEDMMTARRRDVTVPTLKRVSIVPTFTRDGRLLADPGFDEASGIFLDLKVDVDVPPQPTRRQVRAALRQLWFPISQFPFVEKSDKVHALAMILEPYMRDMFGPTPLHFINKPEAGTGASLLIETALYPTLGHWPEAQVPPKGDDEMKKTLTACFAEGVRCIYFDNANLLKSAELASALTAEVYSARILGVSKMLRVPVQVQWVGSGNNTELTNELYRRVNDIRIDAKMERPEDRNISQFRIKNLKEWAVEHQGQQVQAALTIIQFWVNLGMPEGTGSKASYEAWAAKLSGLFDAIGVRGFLATPKDRRPEDPEAEIARELILAMFNAHRGKIEPSGRETDWRKPVKASAVVDLVTAGHVSIDFGFKDPARAMGDLLRRYLGRPFGFEAETGRVFKLTLEKSSYQGTTRWAVVAEVDGEVRVPMHEVDLPEPVPDLPF